MPKWHSARFIYLTLFLVASLFFVGCSDDDDGPTNVDNITYSTSGEIYIQPLPGAEGVSWVLYMPDGTAVPGENTTLLEGQPNGEYTLVWGKLEFHRGPDPSVVTGTLDGTNNLIFTGTYDIRPGSAQIVFDPEQFMGDWTLNLLSAVPYTVTGTGPAILGDLPPGDYRLSVDAPDGMEAATVYGSQSSTSVMSLRAVLTAEDDVLVVEPEPEGIGATWSLVGPEVIELGETSGVEFTASGEGRMVIDLPTVEREREIASGDSTVIDTFTITVVGEYTVTWNAVTNYETPEALTLVHDQDNMLFAASYGVLNGTVNVNGTQSGVDLPWALTMPSGTVVHGAGSQVLTDVPVGTYSVRGLPVDGFTPMDPVSMVLTSNSEITLDVTIQPAILIETAPMGVDAGWHLTGPDGYSLDGNGSMLVEGLAVGCYDLTWDELSGWTAPAAVSNLCIDASSGGVISGEFTRTAGTLYVNVQPAGLDAGWTINGPDGFTASGTGQTALAIGGAGDYEVTWGAVDGYLLPVAETFTYDGEGGMTIPTFYLETIGFAAVPAGNFNQGSLLNETPCRSLLEYSHNVTMTIPYLMQTLEVTNYQYMSLVQWAYDRGYVTADRFGVFDNLDGSTELLLDMDDTDSRIQFSDGVFTCTDPHHPVREVSWYGAVAFCDWLSLYRGRTRAYNHNSWECGFNHPSDALGFRLPTEAEWEYAARAGSTGPYANGIGISYSGFYQSCFSNNLETVSWYGINSGATTHEVGLLTPNTWGIYDMHGNIAEWVNDRMFENYYAPLYAPDTNPRGPLTGDERVYRGGFYHSTCVDVRNASRFSANPANADFFTGFRVVLTGE